MYTGLLHTHSLFRFLILFLLVLTILRLLRNRNTLGKQNKKLILGLMIITHVQLLLGLGLSFLSPYVHYGKKTMSMPELRYWSVEHVITMLAVVVLITLARIYSRKSTPDSAKCKRVLVLLATALILIIVTLFMSGRGVIIPS